MKKAEEETLKKNKKPLDIHLLIQTNTRGNMICPPDHMMKLYSTPKIAEIRGLRIMLVILVIISTIRIRKPFR